MKKFSVKTVVAIGIGAALFFVLGKIAIPSFVANTNISLQYAILAMFATLFGPIAGALIGFIGHTLIDATSYGPWWSWIIASAVVGAIILISIVVFVVKSSGLFRSGKSTTQSTIAATTEAKHHNTTEKYTVDNYIGLSLEAAREAIDNKFKINVTEEYSDTYAKGLVMQQDPESDTELEEGKTIKLVVSKGQKIEDKVSVPDVRSKTKSGAQSELKAAGLKVSIKEAYSDDVAKGEVISQTPSHGSKVSKNTTVVITVSKGKKEDQTVSVPYLRYYTESEASQELQRVGLSLGSVLTEYSDSVEKGLVIRQRISSGSKVKKGTAVGIYVSLGPRQTATTADEESTTTGEE